MPSRYWNNRNKRSGKLETITYQRVDEKDNQVFIKMMERYFDKVSKPYYKGEKLEDAHPENAFQVRIILNKNRME